MGGSRPDLRSTAPRPWVANAALLCLLTHGCTRPPVTARAGADAAPAETDALPSCICDPAGDEDSDGIANGLEGCATCRDTDGDDLPDYNDFDADDDGLPDEQEAGEQSAGGTCATGGPWPCDTDGDGAPDAYDRDSDDDGIEDGIEDRWEYGRVGCCASICGEPDSRMGRSDYCRYEASGCGRGQRCVEGRCEPAAAMACSGGEADPKKAKTFDGAFADAELGIEACFDYPWHPRPGGPPRLAVATHVNRGGEWLVALPADATYFEVLLPEARAIYRGAATFAVPGVPLAGFVFSRCTGRPDLDGAVREVIDDLATVADVQRVQVVALGTSDKTHGRWDVQRGIALELSLGQSSRADQLRNALTLTLMGHAPDAVALPEDASLASSATHRIHLSITRRFAFKREVETKIVLDENGFPVDSGDVAYWHVQVMGVVLRAATPLDPRGALLVEDLSNGSSIEWMCFTSSLRCELALVAGGPQAIFAGRPLPAGLRVFVAGQPLIRGRDFVYRHGTYLPDQPATIEITSPSLRGLPLVAAHASLSGPVFDCPDF